jgi:hypothetical protein
MLRGASIWQVAAFALSVEADVAEQETMPSAHPTSI